MKRFFLVTGPEGSGTYMMAEALASCGVQEVIRGVQTWDTNYAHLIPDMPDLIFTHRSLPAAGVWPDLGYMRDEFSNYDYWFATLFMTRDINATIQSQMGRRCTTNMYDSLRNIRRAYLAVSIPFVSIIPISYEAFTQSEGFRRWLFTELLDLPMPTIEIRQGENEKYYE